MAGRAELPSLSRRRYVLLLEDLAPGRVGDQVSGCTLVDGFSNYFHVLYRKHQRTFLTRDDLRVAPALTELSHWLLEHGPAVMARLARFPLTLNHGDYRLDNLVFGSDGSVTALDWQGPYRGPGALDVAYFVTGNLPVELAREHEETLIHVYHDELVAGGVDHPFDEFLQAYELSKLAIAYRIVLSDLLDLEEGRGQLLLERLFERLAALLPGRREELLVEPATLSTRAEDATAR